MLHRTTLWLALLAVSLLAQPAHALPIGSAPDTRPVPMQLLPEWKTLGLGAQLTGLVLQGNAQFMNLEGALDLAARVERHRFYLNGAGLYNQAGTTVAMNRLSGSAIWTWDVLPQLDLWGFTTHAQDQAMGLRYRASYAAGVCLDRLGVPGFNELFLSYGPALETAWYSNGHAGLDWRHVVRLYANHPLGEQVDLGLDSFFRPVFMEPARFRLYGEAYVRIKLSTLVSLLVTVADEYDTAPRPGFQANDLGTYTTLRWGSGW